MELLTDKVFNAENSIKLMDLIYEVFIKHKDENHSFKNYISYDEFKIIIHKFIIDVMGLFLLDTEYSDDTYDVYIKKMNNRIGGLFYRSNNSLIINENIILNIYNGNMNAFLTIFHELNHFKLKYDILSGVINLDTCRIVKEMLIMDDEPASSSYNDYFKTLKNKNISINNFYYDDNYKLFSEEVVANINSKFDFVTMMRRLLINYNLYNKKNEETCTQFFNELIGDDYLNYENSIRDVSTIYYLNSNSIDFNEAFDILIKYHPEWLEYPQINIEYYVDEDGKVKKRNIEQLRRLLEEYSDVDARSYIKYLIKELEKNNKKDNVRHR